MLIFTVWLIFPRVLLLFIFFTYIWYFLCFTLMATKLSQRWESNSYQKIFCFYTWQKNTVILNLKKKIFIFQTVLESYSKNCTKKIGKKLILSQPWEWGKAGFHFLLLTLFYVCTVVWTRNWPHCCAWGLILLQ
jgi:hypothetical protein